MTPYYSRSRRGKKPNRLKKWLFFAVPLLLIGAGVYWLAFGSRNTADPNPTNTSQTPPADTTPEEPEYTAPDLQPTVNSWVKRYNTDYHIAIYDLQADKMIAEHDADDAVFAASLYKLYIAYLSYKDFQSGAQDPSEVILAGQTRKQCVDKMIRSSDSPCGETFMTDIGQQTLNKRVHDEIGTTATVFNGIETSAADSIAVLKLIANGNELNDSSKKSLLSSMLDQDAKFKRGLASGAPKATWHTKVGWNLDINYHDVGIMTLPDGRQFAVAILGQGSGSPAPIADFAKTIYNALK